jgi:N,N'-diacetyllegionaminate synthase
MKVNIIAEAGVNHNGNIVKAKKLALEAKKIGADYVKYQIFNPDEIAIHNLKKTVYQKKIQEVIQIINMICLRNYH